MDETAKEVCLLPHEKFRTASLINESIKNYIVLLKAPYSEVLRPWPSENEQSSKAVETENILTIVGLHRSKGLTVLCFNS